MKRLAMLALLLALAGCFSSEKPVFEESRGQCPFTTPVRYQELESDGSASPGTVTLAADGAYCTLTEDHADAVPERSLFVPMGPDWWILQSADQTPIYAIMERRGDRLLQYLPACTDFSAARLKQLGVVFDDQRQNCTVTQADQIETLFKQWRRGWGHKPNGAFRRIGG